MDITLANFVFALSVFFLGTFIMAYIYFKYTYTYWKKKGIKYIEPFFPFGNIGDVIIQKKCIGEVFKDIYNYFDGIDIGGVYAFSRPILVIREPEIIKAILVKDFSYFPDHGTCIDEEGDPLMANLFNLTGIRWKNLRTKLSPTFTSGKMKMMFEILVESGDELGNYVEEFASCGNALEVKDVLAKYSTDIIASAAFGIKCNCLKNPDSEFREWGRKIFKPTIKSGIRDISMFLSPTVASVLKIPFVPKDITHYFKNMVKETVTYRENQNVTRNDFMQLLIQLKNNGNVDMDVKNKKQMNGAASSNNTKEVSLTITEVAAQAFVFFVAGFETSSVTMSFCLYELALNPDIQERIQSEIDAVLKKHGAKITYEAIQEMEYLDKAVSETLRKYPPVPFLTRECSKTYKIPGTKVIVEKGMSIIVPVMGIQHDPKYYPKPDKFDPERFSDQEKNKRHPFTHLPFGEGPRICIGMRFGVLQTKVGLVSLLSKNSFQVCEKTSVPLKLDPKSLVLAADGGMWLKVVKRN